MPTVREQLEQKYGAPKSPVATQQQELVAPTSTVRAQLEQKYGAMGIKPEAPIAPAQPSFSQKARTALGYDVNIKRQQDIADRYVAGKSSAPEMVAQSTMNTVGAVAAPVIKGLGGILKGVDYLASGKGAFNPVPQDNAYTALKKGAINTFNKTVDTISDIPSVQNFAQSDESTRFEENLRGANDMLNILPLPKVIAGSKKVITAAEEFATQQSQKSAQKRADNLYSDVAVQYTKAVRPSVRGRGSFAQAQKADTRAGEAVVNIVRRARQLTFVRPDGSSVTGQLPESLNDFAQSIDQSKKNVYTQYNQMARDSGDAGAVLDVMPVIQNLQGFANNIGNTPASRTYALKVAEDIAELHGQTPDIIEMRIAQLNASPSMQNFFLTGSQKIEAQIDASAAQALRNQLDALIENATHAGYAELKREYGSLRSIEKEVSQRALVEARKSNKGFFDITDIFSGAEIAGGILSLNPALVGKGIAMRGLKEYVKYLNNPNRQVRKMFESAKGALDKAEQYGIPTRETPVPRQKTYLPAGPDAPTVQSVESGTPIRPVENNVAVQIPPRLDSRVAQSESRARGLGNIRPASLRPASAPMLALPTPRPPKPKALPLGGTDALGNKIDIGVPKKPAPLGKSFVRAVPAQVGKPRVNPATGRMERTFTSEVATPQKAPTLPEKLKGNAKAEGLHKQITDNVKAQERAYKKGDTAKISALKRAYNYLAKKWDALVQSVKDTPGKQGGFAKNPLGGKKKIHNDEVIAPKNRVTDIAYKKTAENGGVTISLDGGTPSKGYAYAPFKGTETVHVKSDFKESHIIDFVNKNKEALSKKGNHLGIWESEGKVYLDVSRVGDPSVKTIDEAQKASQLAVFDLEHFEELPTGQINNGVYNKLHEATHIHNEYQRKVKGASSQGGDGVVSQIPKSEGRGLGKVDSHLSKAKEALREAKGLSPADIMAKYPDINLKRDVPITDIHGKKHVIPEGEALTPYELKGNKVLLQDGETYIVSKNQWQNIKGNAVSGEAREFAPELKGTEETIKGTQKMAVKEKAYADFDAGKITREERNAIIDKLGVPNETKFSSYTIPGGENYKEILVKAPKSTPDFSDFKITEANKGAKKPFLVESPNSTEWVATRAEAEVALEQLKKSYGKIQQDNKSFKSSHWDEPNVLSHLRMNERTYQGKKVAFMEELQSDWAREGRSKGFSDQVKIDWQPSKNGDLNATYNGKDLTITPEGSKFYVYEKGGVLGRAANTLEQAKTYAQNHVGFGVPSHPLLKNWQTMSVKRALKEAVDSDAEYFAWINGEQTSARYNLATHVKDVEWIPAHKSFNSSVAVGKPVEKVISIKPQTGGVTIDIGIDNKGVIHKINGGGAEWKGKKLDEVLGKGLADKIMEKETGTLSGEGLKFGGEWASTLYDKQVKNIVEDVTGGKVEVLDLGLPVEKNQWFFKKPKVNGVGTEDLKNLSDVKIGDEITVGQIGSGTDSYIITDILGDGKFKAIKAGTENAKAFLGGKSKNIVGFDASKESFDISSKTTTQQGIRLTPEIIARIKGEAPTLKKPSGRNPLGKP